MISVLDPVRHERLIKDMDHVSTVANIPRQFIHTSMKDICDPSEVDWVVDYNVHKESRAGLVLVGKTDVDSHCMAIAGALVRNFIDARVLTLNTVLDGAGKGDAPDPTVMVVPNFYQKSYGKTLPAFKVSLLYDVLLSRFTAGKPTVLAIDCIDDLAAAYGNTFAEHLKNHYLIV